jgi:hypothetical protein
MLICWIDDDGSVLRDEELLHDASEARALLSAGGDALDKPRSTLAVVFLPNFLDDQFLYFLLKLQLSAAYCVLSIARLSRVLFVY